MRTVTITVETWACGECSNDVDHEAPFAWCGGCAKRLCRACIEAAASCDHCDMIVCKHCALRFFTLDCASCGSSLHFDCATRGTAGSSHALCGSCGQSAAALSG